MTSATEVAPTVDVNVAPTQLPVKQAPAQKAPATQAPATPTQVIKPAEQASLTENSSVGRDAAALASQSILAAVVPTGNSAAGDTNAKPMTAAQPGKNNVATSSAAAQAAENAVRLARGEIASSQNTASANSGSDLADLQQITGIGPIVATQLQALGVAHIADIAKWTPEDVARISSKLAINGRINREDWIGQARTLIANRAHEVDVKA